MSSLGKNVSWLMLMKVFNYLLPLVSLPYLTNVLGLKLFGVLAIGLAIQQVVVSICDYGFSLYGPKYVAENRTDHFLIGQLFTAILIIKALLFAFFAVCTYFVFHLFEVEANKAELWMLMLIPSFLQSMLPLWYFLGVERMANVTIVNVIERLLYTLSIFVFIKVADDVSIIPYIMLATMGAACCLSITFLFMSDVRPQKCSLNYLKSTLKDSWGYFYSRITILIYSRFNVLIVASVLGEGAAGIFSLAERVYNAARSMSAPLTDAIYPYMVRTRNFTLAKKIIYIAILFAFFVCFVCFFSSNWFFSYFGAGFEGTATVFNILMLAYGFSLISMLIGYPVLGAQGHVDRVNRSVLYGALIHLVVVLTMMSLNILTEISLAVAVVITESFVFAYRIYFVTKLNALSPMENLEAVNDLK